MEDGHIETYRGVVYPWDCDSLGHLNVAGYARMFDEANWHLHSALGITRDYIERSGCAFVALQNDIRYRRELRAGTLLYVRSGVLEVRDKTLRMLSEMYDAEQGWLAATCEGVTCHFDMGARRACPWPDALRARAQRHRIEPEGRRSG